MGADRKIVRRKMLSLAKANALNLANCESVSPVELGFDCEDQVIRDKITRFYKRLQGSIGFEALMLRVDLAPLIRNFNRTFPAFWRLITGQPDKHFCVIMLPQFFLSEDSGLDPIASASLKILPQLSMVRLPGHQACLARRQQPFDPSRLFSPIEAIDYEAYLLGVLNLALSGSRSTIDFDAQREREYWPTSLVFEESFLDTGEQSRYDFYQRQTTTLKCYLWTLRLYRTGGVDLSRGYLLEESLDKGYCWQYAFSSKSLNQGDYYLGSRDVPRVRRLYTMVSGVFGSIEPSIQVAMDNFERAYESRNRQVKLLHLYIALESLVSASPETAYRLRMRLAFLIGVTEKERLKIYQLMGPLYNLRNSLAHGHQNATTEKATKKAFRAITGQDADAKVALAGVTTYLENLVGTSLVISMTLQGRSQLPSQDTLEESVILNPARTLRSLIRQARDLTDRAASLAL